VIRKEAEVWLAGVAVESMTNISTESFGFLTELLEAKLPLPRRFLAYCGVGLSKHPQAYPFLVQALEQEPAVKDAVAYALALLGNQEAIPEIYAAYKDWQDPMAPELEEAVGMLAFPDDKDRGALNWRIRYRPRPDLGGLPALNLQTIGAMARTFPKLTRRLLKTHPVKKALGQILDEQKRQWANDSDAPIACEHCQQPSTMFWGLPTCTCPETTMTTSREIVEACLASAKWNRAELIAEALDFLDLEAFELLRAPRRKQEEEMILISLYRTVWHAFLERGIRTLAEAESAFANASGGMLNV
jgi:hypothetical protein